MHIEAGLRRPPRARAIRGDERVDLVDRHRAGTVPAGDVLASVELTGCHGGSPFAASASPSGPSPSHGRCREDFGPAWWSCAAGDDALLVQEIGDAAQRRDVIVGPDAEVAIGVAADRVDDQPFGHHRAGAADRVLSRDAGNASRSPNRRAPILYICIGRDDDPVREGNGAQPKRAEQQRLDHRHSLLSLGKSAARITRPPPRRACPRPAGFAAGPRSERRSSRRRGRHRRHHRPGGAIWPLSAPNTPCLTKKRQVTGTSLRMRVSAE